LPTSRSSSGLRRARGARSLGPRAPGDSSIGELYAANDQQHRAIRQALAARSAAGARSLAREHVLQSLHLLEVVRAQGAQAAGWRNGRRRRSGASARPLTRCGDAPPS
jgi:hypothetical protein